MKNLKRITAILLTAALLIGIVAFFPQKSVAALNENEYKHIDPRSIEDSTLIIGTHLIHLNALNEQLYAIAKDTQATSEQYNIYYKSELADGAWIDITNATSLASITADGTPVSEDEIRGLYLRWWTKSDKITYDLLTGGSTNMYGTLNCYDLYNREEIAQVRAIFDGYQESLDNHEEISESTDYLYKLLLKFFWNDLTNDTTNRCGQDLDALQRYYTQLSTSGAPGADMQQVANVMELVEGERELAILDIISRDLDVLEVISGGHDPYKYYVRKSLKNALYPFDARTDSLRWIYGGSFYDYSIVDVDYQIDFESDSTLEQAIVYAKQSVEEARVKYRVMSDINGDMVTDKEKYDNSKGMLDNAKAGNFRGCDENVEKLNYLENIGSGTVVNKEGELGYLYSTLIVKAYDNYSKEVSAGISAEYRQSLSNTALSKSYLLKMLKDQANPMNSQLSELEEFITAICEREDGEKSLTFLDEKLAEAEALKNQVKDDDFKENALDSVNAYIAFLTKKKIEVSGKLGNSDLDKLLAEKEQYIEDKMSCLDKNDLAGAAKYDALIDGLDDMINEMGGNDKALVESFAEAMDALSKGDMDGLSDAISGLENSLVAAPATGLELMNELLSAISDKVDAAKSNSLKDIGSGSGSGGSGSGTGGTGDGSGSGTGGTGDGSGSGSGSGGSGSGTSGAADGSGEYEGTSNDGVSDSMYNDLLEMMDDLEETIAENTNLLDGRLSKEEIKNLLESLFGGPFSSLSAEQQAGILLALNMYVDHTKDASIKSYLASLANRFYNEGNDYIYIKYGVNTEYMSAPTLGKITSYRYIYDDNEKVGTLARGTTYYNFTVGSDVSIKADGKDLLSVDTVFLGGLYFDEDYSYDVFGYEAEYLIGNDFAVAANDTMLADAREIFEVLLSALSIN